MPRNIEFSEGEYYHIYNRGTDKRVIFENEADYDRFITLLYICNGDVPVHLQRQGRTLTEVMDVERGAPLVAIGAYCLMPNHFHLLLREIQQGGISKFMQKLGNAYTGYFNRRHDRTGALFQSKFKGKHATHDAYLKYLISYIHLNPVKIIDPQWKEAGISNKRTASKYLEQYPYSSYSDYRNIERVETALLDRKEFPEYFETSGDFNSCVQEWLSFSEE